ncbi:MAG: 16S rRNA (cytosine(967)-C(5))-methyltransferase RsmB [Lachnospiraceae bacterium]|nr:MAG: 16S rRNA (cytosine(967)-C(5))-methyltransferase RsmB [Lachnospiraceae bacterium]
MEKTNIRTLILEALMLIDVEGEYSHKVIDMALEKYSYLSKADRGFFSKVVHGVVEYRLQLDFIIKKYNGGKRIKPVIREILRMAIYQMLYMDRVPDRAIINEAVNLVKLRRLTALTGFVNGILRKISSEKETVSFDDIGIRYSMPEFLLDIIKENTGKYFDKTLEYFLEGRPVSIRVNTSKSKVTDVVKELEESNIRVERSSLNDTVLYIRGFDKVDDISVIKSGKCYITDVSSSMIAELIIPDNIKKVLDVCAAPGGKSFLLADKLDNEALIYSCDISENKVNLIMENAKVQGFKNIIPLVADARVFDERFAESDLVVADLPCSGIGIIGKKPDIKYRLNAENMISLAALQKEILDNVSQYVKIGGELIFSTCTLNKAENEENVSLFLKNHSDFKAVDLTKRLKSTLIEKFDKDELEKGYLKLIPGRDGCDGFFIAVFRRDDD